MEITVPITLAPRVVPAASFNMIWRASVRSLRDLSGTEIASERRVRNDRMELMAKPMRAPPAPCGGAGLNSDTLLTAATTPRSALRTRHEVCRHGRDQPRLFDGQNGEGRRLGRDNCMSSTPAPPTPATTPSLRCSAASPAGSDRARRSLDKADSICSPDPTKGENRAKRGELYSQDRSQQAGAAEMPAV